jgi:hypothetical protein
LKVEHVDFLVEEPSMEIFLREVLPNLLGDVSFDVFPFECKPDLLSCLRARLKGYKPWITQSHKIVVLVDRDDDDCLVLKQTMERCSDDAGLPTRSNSRDGHFSVVHRIVVEELEAWYFGDWEAVRIAYPRVPATIPRKVQYRDPDRIKGGTWEAFERIVKSAGYFKTGLRKRELARSIAPHMKPSQNTSKSFNIFRDTVLEMTGR